MELPDSPRSRRNRRARERRAKARQEANNTAEQVVVVPGEQVVVVPAEEVAIMPVEQPTVVPIVQDVDLAETMRDPESPRSRRNRRARERRAQAREEANKAAEQIIAVLAEQVGAVSIEQVAIMPAEQPEIVPAEQVANLAEMMTDPESPHSRRNRRARERRAKAREEANNATVVALPVEQVVVMPAEQVATVPAEQATAVPAEQAEQAAAIPIAPRMEEMFEGLILDDPVVEEEAHIEARVETRVDNSNIPPARQVFDAAAGSIRHTLERMNVRCEMCRAFHWIEERIGDRGSTVTHPIFTMCCDHGKVDLLPLAAPPEPLQSLLRDNTREAKEFRKNIRAYNSALSFTSLGAKIDERFAQGGNYTFRLQGSLYHRMGSLLPEQGQNRSFSQLYIADSSTALDGRMNVFGTLNPHTMHQLQDMLHEHNPYVQLYENVRQRMAEEPAIDLELRLLSLRSQDRRRYNTPTTNEIGAIMVGDGHDGSLSDRDIIIKRVGGPLQRISALHSAYTPLHYVLLFPDGRQGWSLNIPLQGFSFNDGRFEVIDPNARRGRGGSMRVTQMQFYAYYLHPRERGEHIFLAGRLLQQYIVDAWACVEQNRLQFFIDNQSNLRCELYSGVMDALNAGDHDALQIGQRMILPSSFAGGDRQMNQLYQDAMAIVRRFGRPDLFITFTCNPKWPEITVELEEGQNTQDRPDLVARVFKLKFVELMHDLKDRKIFGTVLGFVWVIEFQKRGLPHAHILLILDEQSKMRTTDEINSAVSAEIPDVMTHPDAYETVIRCLIHGPCGIENPSATCMEDRKCVKQFPKAFATETCADNDGYPIYRRRDDGRFFIDAKGLRVDNRWIVPHNLYLTSKYNAHINVEVCSSISAVKYIFKYVYKGHDQTTVVLQGINEIQQYIDARYVSAPEATWRLMSFKMHDAFPHVQRLQVHLPDQQYVTFNPEHDLADTVNTERVRRTTLTQWFEANRTIPLARDTTYSDFPSYFTWNYARRLWTIRRQGICVGRMFFVSPNAGERNFLRTLLTIVKGATSFQDLKQYNDVDYESFKDACVARGLYENDDEWGQCLGEAALMQSGAQLRSLFVTILIHGPPANPRQLWEQFSENLSDDCAHRLRQDGGVEEPSQERIRSLALNLIAQLLLAYEKTLTDFSLPEPTFNIRELQGNRLIAEQLNFDATELRREVNQQVQSLNVEQMEIYQQIMQSCARDISDKIYFIDGPGGTGKTYLENLLLKSVRGQSKIALAVASSGIAALLLRKGQTAHSRFKIPIELSSTSVCAFSKQSDRAEMIRQSKLILWDEAPMMSKFAFEAVDRTLRDITNRNLPFGGITFVMSGDFRQVLPVVPRGLRPDIVAASLKESYLWNYVHVCRLQQNMRAVTAEIHADLGNRTFAAWLLALGENRLEQVQDDFIKCPPSMVVGEHTLNGLIESVYGGIADIAQGAQDYFGGRAILAARNDDVACINNVVLDMVNGDMHEYLSADKVDDEIGANVISVEFLNMLDVNGWPPHKLLLKVGSPVMLLRNLDVSNGLCNGTRLIVRRCAARVIEAEVIIGDHTGYIAFIPRIALTSEKTGLPFSVRRKQFPLRVAYAMTINKSQGQTLPKVGICLNRNVFSHGQLYVAFSRATAPENVSVLLEADSVDRLMRNVVYEEALR